MAKLRHARGGAGDSQPSARELQRVLEYAQKRYFEHSNVLGIGIGTKFKRRRATEEHASIQFFVSKKVRARDLPSRERLPKFLYRRNPNGSVDRRSRVPTDVIKVGRVRAACGAGSPVEVLGRGGAIALLFRNKTAAGGSFLVSCAHVVGDLINPVPVSDELESDCRPTEHPFARTVVTATAIGGELAYDIALARVVRELSKSEDLCVDTDPPVRLSRFLPREEIRAPLLCDCAFPVSNVVSAPVVSYAGKVRVAYRQGELLVKDAFVLGARTAEGDSGGLIYIDDAAVGIAFAHSPDGFAWFHPLVQAFEFLSQLYPEPLQCFS